MAAEEYNFKRICGITEPALRPKGLLKNGHSSFKAILSGNLK